MAEPPLSSIGDMISPNQTATTTTSDFDSLPIPPLDPTIFSDDLMLSDHFLQDLDLDMDFDLDIDTFDDHGYQDFLASSNIQPTATLYPSNSSSSCSDVSRFLNEEEEEKYGGSNREESELNGARVVDHPSSSPKAASSQGSGSDVLDLDAQNNYPSPDDDSGDCSLSLPSCPSSSASSRQKIIKLEKEEEGVLKRKKDNEDVNCVAKYRRSNPSDEEDDDEKRKARLMRNRESAQLSRQRKKHYVEELEDKVRTMHSTIQDLNSKVTYIMAENATLRQQLTTLSGGPPPPTFPMYPYPPWMPCHPPPPYLLKSQGVPLLPIPRLKPQPTPLKSRKPDNRKTKKVASVSFLGLFFFIMLFGGLVPMLNVKYGGMRDAVVGQHQGRVFTVNAPHLNGTHQPNIGGLGSSDEFAHMPNSTTQPLIASLYVPRNDKLVKIDGNLIIHSVLASEKAMASRSDTTGLAVPRDLSPAIPLSTARHPPLYRNPTERHRAIASAAAAAAADKDNLKSKSADGKLQQWFREGLAGPMLRSGMCTEVFQFDVSPVAAPGAIIPASSMRNISVDLHQNSTQLNKGRNRRILHGLPIPLPGSVNITEEHMARNSAKDNFQRNDSLSSMVVSVLVDPREAGDGDGDGMMGPRSLSRIFVVVLLDSVKYVTYSCMLPLKGTGPHLVTT